MIQFIYLYSATEYSIDSMGSFYGYTANFIELSRTLSTEYSDVFNIIFFTEQLYMHIIQCFSRIT